MNASATRFVQRFIPASGAGLWVLWCLTAAPLHAAIFGEFAGATDVGKIGLITIGFSNPSIESAHFKRVADADPQKSPHIVIVNGCIGGRSAVMWAWDGADVLSEAEQERLDKTMDLLGMPKTNRRSSPGLDKDTWPSEPSGSDSHCPPSIAVLELATKERIRGVLVVGSLVCFADGLRSEGNSCRPMIRIA